MLKNIDKKIIVIIVLTILEIILLFMFINGLNNNSSNNSNSFNTSTKNTNKNVISTSAQVESSLTEYVDLHTTYYLKELYVSKGESISSQTKLLKYKNGSYLKSPYDAIISDINMPNEGEKITNDHYIEIQSLNSLKLEFNISESKVSNINIGDEATITISALDGKEYTGYVTSISNKAVNSKFAVVVEFENDGNIMIGMTANITI